MEYVRVRDDRYQANVTRKGYAAVLSRDHVA